MGLLLTYSGASDKLLGRTEWNIRLTKKWQLTYMVLTGIKIQEVQEIWILFSARHYHLEVQANPN